MSRENQDLYKIFCELCRQMQNTDSSSSMSATISVIPNPLPSNSPQPDNSNNYNYSIEFLASICLGLLVGVPITLFCLVKVYDFIHNRFYDVNQSSSVAPDLNIVEMYTGVNVDEHDTLPEDGRIDHTASLEWNMTGEQPSQNATNFEDI